MKQKAILSILCLVGCLFFLISFVEEDKTFIERTPHNAITNPHEVSGITDNYRSDSSRPNNFVPQGDGTVIDKRTGLQWMRCSLGKKWTGKTCSGEPSEYEWQDALNQNPKFAGYNDWRLPTRFELETLVYCSSEEDRGRGGKDNLFILNGCDGNYQRPTIVQKAFPNAYANGWFWTSSPYTYNHSFAWYVYFGLGGVSHSHKDASKHVRLVRGRQ